MELRDTLNSIYRPIHGIGRNLLKGLLDLGYDAKLCYSNMHEVKIEDNYQTEYFPLPEIVISNVAVSADLGITLDQTAWLELTITRDIALRINYEELSKTARLEVYGANNYLEDFYNETMCTENVVKKIENSTEQQIHLCFYFNECDMKTIEVLLNHLHNKNIITKQSI